MKILYGLVVLLFLTGNLYSQEVINQFKNRIDFNMLDNIVKLTSDDSIFVSNSKQYDINNYTDTKDFYFYDSKTKNKMFSNGYQVAYPFVGKTAVVKYKGHWGLIDRAGKFIHYTDFEGEVKLSSYEKYVMFGDAMYDMRNGISHENFIYCAEPETPHYFITKTKNGTYILTKKAGDQSIFKAEMDSIIPQNHLIYRGNTIHNLLILKKKNKYGLYLPDETEILKVQYEKAKFLGDYFMLYHNKRWNYYTYTDNKLNLITSTTFECNTPAYQKNIIGVFKKDNKYNLLHINGEILPSGFDYISDNATYGVDRNSIVIFDINGRYHKYIDAN